MVVWSPSKAPEMKDEDGKALAGWVEAELERFQTDNLENIDVLDLRPSYNPPLRPREGIIVYADGTKWNPGNGAGPYYRTASGLWKPMWRGREMLTADRTYYVRTDGSDASTGLVDGPGTAFLTLQKAHDTIVQSLDLAGFTVTIQIRDGTFTGGVQLRPWTGAGMVVYQGNVATPTNVSISTTSSDCFNASFGPLPGIVRIKDMKLKTTTSGYGIVSRSVGRVQYTKITFEACASGHVASTSNALVEPYGASFITGNSGSHFVVDNGGAIVTNANDLPVPISALTITGTPAINVFAYAFGAGRIVVPGLAPSGATTGQRYNGVQHSLINTGGGGINYFPGSVAGVVSASAEYL